MWPGVSLLPNYKTQFPKWRKQPLGRVVPRLDQYGVDLLTVRGLFLRSLRLWWATPQMVATDSELHCRVAKSLPSLSDRCLTYRFSK
jgi:hypothetical protein